MKKITGILVLILIINLAACQENQSIEKTVTQTATNAPAAIVVSTLTPSPTEGSQIRTTTPIETETEPTRYILSTFDPEAVVTVTPAQPAICPPENSGFVFTDEMTELFSAHQPLEFVDKAVEAGATFETIVKYAVDIEGENSSIYLEDLTADGVNEMVVRNIATNIFSCKNSEIIQIFDSNDYAFYGLSGPSIRTPGDMNMDNQPEIIAVYLFTTAGNTIANIMSWDGEMFYSLMEANKNVYLENDVRLANGLYWYYGDAVLYLNYSSDFTKYFPFEMNCIAEISIIDIDNNGTLEMVLNDDGPQKYFTKWKEGPWLGQEVTFTWNGKNFILSDYQLDPPEYRYQALQEADRAFILREYDRAKALYDDVINSTTLKAWSMEYKEYLLAIDSARNNDSGTEDIFMPEMTLDEYQQISAYARFRLMMIQLAAGQEAEALNTFQLLDQIYTEENPGYAHAEMGRIYWQAVEDGMSLIEACQPVKEYVGEHPDLFEAFGNSGLRLQSHIYSVDDVCPLDEMDVELLSGNP